MSLAQALLQGDRRALSRALTWVENATPEGEELLQALFPHTGRAWWGLRVRLGWASPPW